MNILIETEESLEYLTSENLWSKDALQGKKFGTTSAAYDAAKKEDVGRFNIVGYLPQTKQFINLNHGKGRRMEVAA